MTTPFASVVLPRLSARPLRTTSVSVRMPLGRHETASFVLRDAVLAKRIRRDAPVKIVWGEGRRTATFVGYVNRKTHKVERGQPYITVLCIGCSSTMGRARSRAWRGTLPAIVGSIAKRRKRTAVVEPSKVKIKVNQAGINDWQFLKQLAERSGRVLYARGTSIGLVTRNYWMASRKSAPVLVVQSFRLQATNHDPYRPAGVQVQGMDRSGTVVRAVARGANPSATRIANTVVRSAEEAAEVAIAERELASYTVHGTIEAFGDVRVMQAKPVYLQRSDPRVDRQYVGYWLVDEVVHTVEGGRYLMKIKAVTSSLPALVEGVDRLPTRLLPDEAHNDGLTSSPVPGDVPDGTVDPDMPEPSDEAELAEDPDEAADVLDPEDPEPVDLDAFADALEDPEDPCAFLEGPDEAATMWAADPAEVGLVTSPFSDDEDDEDEEFDELEDTDEDIPLGDEPEEPAVEEVDPEELAELDLESEEEPDLPEVVEPEPAPEPAEPAPATPAATKLAAGSSILTTDVRDTILIDNPAARLVLDAVAQRTSIDLESRGASTTITLEG